MRQSIRHDFILQSCRRKLRRKRDGLVDGQMKERGPTENGEMHPTSRARPMF